MGRTDEGGSTAPDRARTLPARAAVDAPGGIAEARSWSRWLGGGTPREVLARIVHGDPLAVRRRASARLRARALFVDVDRVHLRSLARIARYAVRYRGRPSLDAWIAAQVDRAIDELLEEELAGAGAGACPMGPHSAHASLAGPLGLDPDAMRRACAAVNARADPDRRAFYALVVEGATLDELARAEGAPVSDLGRRLRAALEGVLRAASPAGGER